MILLDTANKILKGASAISPKKNSKKLKFITTSTETSSSKKILSKEIADINPMTFLQEISEYDTEHKNLEEFGKKAIFCLKKLQLALLNGEIQEEHLYDIKDALKRSELKFTIPELTAIAEEISIRMEVEIAKIERNKKQS